MRTLILSLVVIASATIYAQSATFQRGELVRVQPPTAPSEPKIPVLDPGAPKQRSEMVLKVVAIPNDRIRIDKSAIYINDVQVTGFSPDFVARVVGAPRRVPQVVPEGHYFVMGEQRINQNISEYWGQHFGGQLERAPQ
jgi:signal peptidase I